MSIIKLSELITQNNNKLKIDNNHIKFDENDKELLIFTDIEFDYKINININKIKVLYHIFIYDINSKSDISIPEMIIEKARKFQFENCNFLHDAILEDKEIKCNNCKFEKNLSADKQSNFYYCEFNTIQNTINIYGGKINVLEIKNKIFQDKFYLNRQDENNNDILEINEVQIDNTTFKNKFKLHNSKIKKISIRDTDFEKDADFFKCKFIQDDNEKDNNIYFKNINFDDLVIFDEVLFKEKIYFNYVTFNGYVNFRNATFERGLDLELTNIKNDINFYAIDIKDTSNTSQETYRIIKYQFEKIGNKIEANKYHSLELEQRRKELKKTKFKNFQEYIVFNLHKLSSNHSQNWILSLFWIILIGIVTEYIVSNMGFKISFDYLNHTIQYMSLLTPRGMFCDNNIAFIINKILLGYLYYQFLTAIRKDTRK